MSSVRSPGARYISLTTFKRDGTAVSTPVWVATWKARRLTRNPQVFGRADGLLRRRRRLRHRASTRSPARPDDDACDRNLARDHRIEESGGALAAHLTGGQVASV